MTRYFTNPYLDVRTGECILSTELNVSPAKYLEEALNTVNLCLEDRSTQASVRDGCLYTGCTGIIWAALRIYQTMAGPNEESGKLLQKVRPLLEQTIRLAANVDKQNKEQQLAFLVGLPGLWLTAATFYHLVAELVERNKFIGLYIQLAPHFATTVVFPQGSDELFIGRGGYLTGLYELQKLTSEMIVSNDVINSLCDSIIASGRRYATKHRSQSPLMFAYHGTEYLGAGHGLCGILFALMRFPGYLKKHKESADLVKKSVAYLISVTPPEYGNLPVSTDELPPHKHRSPSDNELVHWCHGATGAVFVYARAYLLWNNADFLVEAKRCADVIWTRGVLKKGPGICHGIAGSGYAQLLLYRLTKEDRYLQRAKAFVHFLQHPLFKTDARTPDSPYSLYEGLAGTSCFMADVSDPGNSSFPLMDVF